MTTPQPSTSTERVRALRLRRKAAGLVRLELDVHPDDAAQIRRKADQLAILRQRLKT